MKLRWRKSSRSGNDANCVELAWSNDVALIRDSKHPAAGALTLPAQSLTHLTTTAKQH